MDPLSLLTVYLSERLLNASWNAVLGPREQGRVSQLVERATNRTVEPVAQEQDSDFADHLGTLLRQFVSAGGLPQLLRAAEANDQVDIDALLDEFVGQELDPVTLGVEPEALLSDLAVNFLSELNTDARQADSPLYNAVSLDRLDYVIRTLTGAAVSRDDLRRAVSSISRPVIQELQAGHAVTARPELQQRVDEFLQSTKRYLIILGPSGTGKSVALAREARRLRTVGWAALVVRAYGLSWAETASAVSAELPQPPAMVDWRRLLVAPWRPNLPQGEQGLVIVVDAVNGPEGEDQSRVLAELIRLSDAISDVPPDRIKVVLSCESSAWSRIQARLPFAQGAASRRPSDRTVVVDFADFGDEELDEALRGVGVGEFRRVDRPDGRSDPHVDSMRDLLRHPATFGLYARLRQRGGNIEPEDATPADLASSLVEQQLGDAAVLCHTAPAILSGYLVELSNLVLQRRSEEFRLSVQSVQATGSLEGLNLPSTDPLHSPFAALVDRGILTPIEESTSAPFIGFRLQDVGVHFLSIHLAAQAEGLTPVDFRALVDGLLEKAYRFPPLFGAVVSWANRLAREGEQGQLVTILRALFESNDYRTEVVARLLSPLAASALLQAAQEAGPAGWQYGTAVSAFRPGRLGLQAFRDGLQSQPTLIVRLSATAVGLARDPDSVPYLAGLLEHQEEDIRRVVSNALGRIGGPAVPYLLGIIGDASLATTRRVRALTALRATGFRTEDVAPTLAQCLGEVPLEDYDLTRGLLLAGAKLRVPGLTPFAILALTSTDWQTALAAAKLLREVADESAVGALRSAIDAWSSRGESNHLRSLVVWQIVIALLQSPSIENQILALELVRSGLRDVGPLEPDDAAKLPEVLRFPLGRGAVLDELATSVRPGPVTRGTFLLFRSLGATWRPADLDAVADVAQQLRHGGRAISAPVVDAIIQAIQGEDDSPLSVTEFQIDAVQALARCQAPDLVEQLCRLLPHADGRLFRHVAYVLWVFGSDAAEEPLWAAYQSRSLDDRNDVPFAHEVIRTLATCGTMRSREGILTYTRAMPHFAFEYDEDVLVPLLRRGVLTEEDLASVVRDQHAVVKGCVACVRALAGYAPRRWIPLFRSLVEIRSQPELQHAGIVALAMAEDEDSSSLLAESIGTIVKTWADTSGKSDSEEATSLSWKVGTMALVLADLGAMEAVPLIEEALRVFPGRLSDLARIVEALGKLAAPSSLQPLVKVSKDQASRSVMDSVVQALGHYLPDPEAEEVIIQALASGSGGYDDRGSQLAAIKALARNDPNLLLDELRDLYRFGHLESSARQWLSLHAPYLARAEGIDVDRLVALLTALVSDRDFWVRELIYQTIDRVPSEFVMAVRARLMASVDTRERASAIRLSGALDDDSVDIDTFRYDPELLLRDAADAAVRAKEAREDLSTLVERFGSSNPSERVAVFFALESQGNEWAMRRLFERYPEGNAASYWTGSLDTAIQYRRRDEHRKRGKEEDRKSERLDTITFD